MEFLRCLDLGMCRVTPRFKGTYSCTLWKYVDLKKYIFLGVGDPSFIDVLSWELALPPCQVQMLLSPEYAPLHHGYGIFDCLLVQPVWLDIWIVPCLLVQWKRPMPCRQRGPMHHFKWWRNSRHHGFIGTLPNEILDYSQLTAKSGDSYGTLAAFTLAAREAGEKCQEYFP